MLFTSYFPLLCSPFKLHSTLHSLFISGFILMCQEPTSALIFFSPFLPHWVMTSQFLSPSSLWILTLFFLMELVFALRVSCLLSRCSTAWVTCQSQPLNFGVTQVFVFWFIFSLFSLSPWWPHLLSCYNYNRNNNNLNDTLHFEYLL
jgi:hypothetical protein